MIVSCEKKRIDKELDKAEYLIVRQTDEAMKIMDSINFLYKLSGEQHARCDILALYAKDLAGVDISKETIMTETALNNARNFLKDRSNPKYLAYTEYYLGRTARMQGRIEQAMQFYRNAMKTAENLDDKNIKGLILSHIGQIFHDEKKYKTAVERFSEALTHFDSTQYNRKRKLGILNNMGNSFFFDNNRDSAMICYNKAFLLAESAQDSAYIMHNTGAAYSKVGEFDKAKQRLLSALSLNSDSILTGIIYLSLSDIHLKEKSTDSAAYFAELSLNFLENRDDKTDIRFILKMYGRLVELDEYNKNYDKALNYSKLFIKYLRKKNKNIPDIRNVELEHELATLKNKTKVICQWYMVVVFCLCFIMTEIVCFFIKHIRKKKLKLSKLNDMIAEVRNETDKQKKLFNRQSSIKSNMLADAHSAIEKQKSILEETQLNLIETEEIKDLFRKVLNDIYKDIYRLSTDPVLFNMLNRNKRSTSDEIVKYLQNVLHKHNTWEYIYDQEKSIFGEIKKLCPDFTNTEYKIVCLEYIGYSTFIEAKIINIGEHSVAQNKTNIRKKLNIHGQIGPFIVEKLALIRKNSRL
jgi:tetratricopeptide (TPR) repeat protein